MTSAPAASTVRADGASYAVTMTSGGSLPLRAAMSGAVRRCEAARVGVELDISAPPSSRARTAPGDLERLPEAVHSCHVVMARPRSAGVQAPVERLAQEMIPATLHAHLDVVTGELVVGRAELRELG